MTSTGTRGVAGTTRSDDVPTPRLTFGGLVRSEVVKARGLRSTTRLLATTVVLLLTGALFTAAVRRSEVDGADEALAAALGTVVDPAFVTLLLVVLLGTLVYTTEYERGAVMTTFTAAPRRPAVVLAEVVVVATTVLVAVAVAAVAAFVGAALVYGADPLAGLADPGVVRALAGTAFYSAAAATIALCIGLLVRSSVGAVAATLAFLYVVPALLQAISSAAVTAVARTIPGPASAVLEAAVGAPGDLSYGAALLAVTAWTAAWVALTWVVVQRRDV